MGAKLLQFCAVRANSGQSVWRAHQGGWHPDSRMPGAATTSADASPHQGATASAASDHVHAAEPCGLPTQAEAGWRMPGYSLQRFLGAGDGGEVWLAESEATGERVALKRVPLSASAQDRRRLRREATFLSTFSHPHVIALHSVLGVPDGLVLVLQYAAGGSLSTLLTERHHLHPSEVVSVIEAVASALTVAHRAGLLHGDVSPGNVLFDATGKPLLADLGTARLVGEPCPDIRGTDAYLAPEVCAGALPTSAADVYALAAVAAHCLTGRPLRAQAQGQKTRAAGSAEASRTWASHAHEMDVPRPLIRAVSSGLATTAQDRPSAQQLAAAMLVACPARVVSLHGGFDEPVLRDGMAKETCAMRRTGGVMTPYGSITRRIPRVSELPPVSAQSHHPSSPRSGFVARCTKIFSRIWNAARSMSNVAHVRRAAYVLVILVISAAAGIVGVTWFSESGAPSPSSSSSVLASRNAANPTSSRSWEETLSRLDEYRMRAFAKTDAALLSKVYLPNSEPLRLDSEKIRSLRSAHVYAIDVRHRIHVTRIRETSAEKALLEVKEDMWPYAIVPAASSKASAQQREAGMSEVPSHAAPARTGIPMTMTLESLGGGNNDGAMESSSGSVWRIAAIRAG